jgi:hypothetical protein
MKYMSSKEDKKSIHEQKKIQVRRIYESFNLSQLRE